MLSIETRTTLRKITRSVLDMYFEMFMRHSDGAIKERSWSLGFKCEVWSKLRKWKNRLENLLEKRVGDKNDTTLKQ